MACGSDDFLLEKNREMKKALEALGIRVDYEETPGSDGCCVIDADGFMVTCFCTGEGL